MRCETEQLIASISTEEAEKMYDNLVKKMFRNKEIMAPILKMVVPEYKDCSLEEIIACMEGIPFLNGAYTMLQGGLVNSLVY